MNLVNLLMVLVNTLCLFGFAILWSRLNRPAKEDPRFTKSLQTLQSKIAILEDLSDRIDQQSAQVTTILDRKLHDLRAQITESEKERERIELSRKKSLETAQIFRDKIPHHEIIERAQMTKYVQVAKEAHAGRSVEQICANTDIPRAEVEFIVKLNREQLMFDERRLPGWIDSATSLETAPPMPEKHLKIDMSHKEDMTNDDLEFRRLSEAFKTAQSASPKELMQQSAPQPKVQRSEVDLPGIVRPYEFPRIT